MRKPAELRNALRTQFSAESPPVGAALGTPTEYEEESFVQLEGSPWPDVPDEMILTMGRALIDTLSDAALSFYVPKFFDLYLKTVSASKLDEDAKENLTDMIFPLVTPPEGPRFQQWLLLSFFNSLNSEQLSTVREIVLTLYENMYDKDDPEAIRGKLFWLHAQDVPQ